MGCRQLSYHQNQEEKPNPFLGVWKKERLENVDAQFLGTLEEKSCSEKFCYSYLPFGGAFNHYSSGTENLYKLTGNEEQKEWSVHDFNARMYDSWLGRFNSIDPLADIGQESWNPYHYNYNNPLTFVDPTGLTPEATEEEMEKFEKAKSLGTNVYNSEDGWIGESGNGGGKKKKGLGIHDDGPEKPNNTPADISIDGTGLNFNPQNRKDGGSWIDKTVDWIGNHSEQIGITVAAGLNAYAGFEELKAGLGMLAAPTGVTQVAGAYAIGDGIVRMASAPFQIYGAWTGNTSLVNSPHNLLGLTGFFIDSGLSGQWMTGGTAQKWMGLGGDFGLSRMKLIEMVSKGFSNPNTLLKMKDIGNAGWQIVRPYKDAIQKGLEKK